VFLTKVLLVLFVPQIDVAVFLPIVFSLCVMGIVFYGFGLVYVLFKFVSRIKMYFNGFHKIQQFEKVLKVF
jgi:hypothetical protein